MNKGCLNCEFNVTVTYFNGFMSFECGHKSNLKIIHKFDSDVTKYKKSQKRLNKKRDCKNYVDMSPREKPKPPPPPPKKSTNEIPGKPIELEKVPFG